MADTDQQPAAAAKEHKMMLLQVSESEWAVVMLDELTGHVRELRVDAATAGKVQAGQLSPEQLAGMLAEQQAAAGQAGEGGEGGSGEGKAS